MDSATVAPTQTKPPCQLKGTLFTFHVLNILDENLATLCAYLEHIVAQSPKFFYQAPLIIDMQMVQLDENTFTHLLTELKKLNFAPIGLKNTGLFAENLAKFHGLALFSADKLKNAKEINPPAPESVASEPEKIIASALIIQTPVRSGQQIYAEGDLIVHAAVSYGAELLARGHIHVYGPLRGRAMAGVDGKKEARIYCSSLEAELIAIAGRYWLSDELKPAYKKNVCIYLNQKEELRLEEIA